MTHSKNYNPTARPYQLKAARIVDNTVADFLANGYRPYVNYRCPTLVVFRARHDNGNVLLLTAKPIANEWRISVNGKIAKEGRIYG